MSTESQAVDHYEAVLADLRAKREQIDQAIQVIEALRGGAPAPAAKVAPVSQVDADVDGPGAFLGMTIVDAAKKLLASRRRTMSNTEIVGALKTGGLAMNSADPINTVGSVLTRRFNTAGDIVRMGRGIWGLAEWYPGRNFKKKLKDAPPEPDQPPAAETLEDRLGLHVVAAATPKRALDLDGPEDSWSPVDGPVRGAINLD